MFHFLCTSLGRHFPDGEVILRRYTKRIGDAIEEGEHGSNVNGFGDLVFCPSCRAQLFDVFGRRTVGGFRDELRVVQQGALRLGQAGLIELAFENGCNCLIGRSLNTQEVGVAIQSIWAAIEEGDVAGDHLLGTAVEVAFGEMDRVGELDDLAEEIGTCAEAFDDSGDLLAAGTCAPVVVGGGGIAGGGGIFGDFDLGFGSWRFRFCVVGFHGML
jgi:hypothetical protein